MARGYPDYFGYSSFPSCGAATEDGANIVVGGGDETLIYEIAGKGVLYNTNMFTGDIDSNEDDRLRCYVNNVVISNLSWSELLLFNKRVGVLGEFGVSCFDSVHYRYEAMLVGPISFDIAVRITYENTGLNDVSVYGYITYARYV